MDYQFVFAPRSIKGAIRRGSRPERPLKTRPPLLIDSTADNVNVIIRSKRW